MRQQSVRRATLRPGSSPSWACISSPRPAGSRGESPFFSWTQVTYKARQTCTMSMFSPPRFSFASLRSDAYIFNSHLHPLEFILLPVTQQIHLGKSDLQGRPFSLDGSQEGGSWTSFHELRAEMRWRLLLGNLGPTFFLCQPTLPSEEYLAFG